MKNLLNKFMLSTKYFAAMIALLGLLMVGGNSWGQQVIGSFPYMDGGFEGQTATTSISGTLSTTAWSVSSGSNSTTKSIIIDVVAARSGSKYASHTTSATTVRLQSPTTATTANAPTPSGSYTVQYYFKTTTDQSTAGATQSLQGSIYNDATNSKSVAVTATNYQSGVWTKATTTNTINGAAVTASTNFAGVRHLLATSSNVLVDDFVVYAGAVDITPPASPTLPTVSGTTVSWTADAGGVDGGGYMVVRYATNPNADNDPNVNGIYAVGNTITNGTGPLVGTVVYVGTNTSFIDAVAGVSSGNDYYKIYAVDKAFNYSAEIKGTAFVASSPSISSTKTSLTGFSYFQGSGPSAVQTFNVSGINLTNNIIITPSTNYEISSDNFGTTPTSITLNQSGGTVSAQTISVRLKAGLSNGVYTSEVISLASSGATSISVACSGVVTVKYFYSGSGSLATASNWGTNTDGTGTQALNFSSNYQFFVIKNTAAVSTDAQWTVSGIGSKIIVGDPSSAGVTLTVDSIAGTYYGVNGTIDLAEASSGANKLVTKIKLQSIAATAWTASASYTLNQQIFYLGNLYIVTTAGGSGTAAPTHTTGAVAATGVVSPTVAASLTYSAPYTGIITFGSLHSSSEVHFQASAGSWGGNAAFGKVNFENNSSSTLVVPLVVQTSLNLVSGSTLTVNSTSYLYFITGATATIAGKLNTSRASGMFAFSVASPNVTNQAVQFQGAEIVGTSLILTGSTIEYSRGASGTIQYITPRTDYANLVISDGTSVGTNLKSISGSVTISDTLLLSNTMGNNSIAGAGNITLANGATIVRTAGSLDAAPIIANGSAVNVIYNGSTAITSGFEIPTAVAKLKNLTVNNPAGVSLGAIAWTANATYTLNQQIFYLGNLYSVTVAGTSGTAAPTHTAGAATNGSAELTFSTQYAPVAWSANATFNLNQLVFNGSNLYFVNSGGNSGATAPIHTTGSVTVASTVWSANANYTLNQLVTSGVNVYTVSIAGTSGTVAPTHTTGAVATNGVSPATLTYSSVPAAKLTYLASYPGPYTVLGPVFWTANTTYTINQPVFYGGNLYTANIAGTSGITAPVHTTGAVAADGGGTATLTYVAPYTGTTINGTLTLTSGKLTLPANGILRIASGNAIVGGSSSSYIVADPSSVVRMDAIASARVLPIGSATNYLPVTITPASTESLNIKVFEGITADGTSAGTALSAPQKTTGVDAVWNISQVGAAAATNSTVKVEWPASLEGADITAAAAADLGLISNSGTGGWNSPTGSLDKTNHSATATVTSFGSFSAGRAAMLFAQPAAKTYGDADFSAGVTSLNASAITYSSNTLSVATIATDGTIHIVGAGTATITASQVVSSDGVYAAVSISRILTVNKKSLTITADNKAKYVGQVNPALTVTYSNDFIAGESATNLTTAPSLSTTAITNSVAGAYPITVSGATSDNYSFVYVNGTLTVNPKLTQTISFTVPSTKVYGDADISVAASSNNNTIAITYTSSNLLVATIAADGTLHIVGAGNTTITASQAGDATYEAASNAKSLTVNKATLTITGVNKTKFINQSNPALTVTYAGFVLGESETILLTPVVAATTALTNSDPGNYPITVNGATAANYDIVFVNGILTIMTAPFEFSAMIARNYGDADFDGGATSINTAQPIVYVSSNLSVATIVNGKIHIVGAGTTDITASQLTDGYYPAGNITRQLVVNKAPSAIVYGALATKTYGNADYIAGATSANSAQTITYASSNPAVATISSTGNIHIVGAGVTDITVSQPGNSNYLAESVTRQLSVSKAVLTITADDKAKYEGQANPALTATYTGFVLGEAASVLLTPAVITTTAVTASLPGTYPITVSGATASNYAISFVSGSLLVNAKLSQTITFAAPTAKVYGNADFSVSASRTNATISLEYTSSNASVATISSTGTIHIVGAGTADLTVMQQANSIYNAASVTRTLTVNKAPLTIAADNKTKYEGQVNPALTLVYEGFVLSESASVLLTPVQITTTAVTASVPATYPITMTGATAANYNITYVSGSLVVQPKLVQTITFAAPATKTYGNADFATGGSSTNASIAVVYSSSNTAVATIVGTNVHIVGAGTADITASQAGSDVYAAATSVVRTLTVNKAALKITADNKSKITEQANPVLTVTYAGFVLNETSAVLQTPTVTSTTAVTASLPGVYPITPSAATAANYLISFVAGNLTVNPKNVQTITFAAPAVKSYGNADFAAGATSTNASIPILYTSSNQQVATIIGNMIHITGAGTAIITATQASDTFYYAALSIAKTLTVNRVPLTVKANDTTKIQGEDNPVFSLSYTGLVAGETGANLLATVSTSAIKSSAAGYYALSATGADTSNYIITYVSGRFTIYPPGGMDQVNLNAFQSSSTQLTLSIFSTQPTAGDAILYNLNGKPIKKMACDIPRGFSNKKMDLPFLLPGLYIMTVKGRGVDCKKVISIL